MNADSEGTLRIVVGVNFTELGDHALDEALRYLIHIDDDELHPVFVLPDPPHDAIGELDAELDAAYAELESRVIRRCEAMDARFDQQVVFHVRLGDPAKAIHQVAVDVDADLIVVGTHGRRGLSKVLLGSVAEELVRTAHVPVLVARPKELDGLPKTERPEAARPGEPLHGAVRMVPTRLTIGKRPSHIAGLV